jgi:hypothetical protein
MLAGGSVDSTVIVQPAASPASIGVSPSFDSATPRRSRFQIQIVPRKPPVPEQKDDSCLVLTDAFTQERFFAPDGLPARSGSETRTTSVSRFRVQRKSLAVKRSSIVDLLGTAPMPAQPPVDLANDELLAF